MRPGRPYVVVVGRFIMPPDVGTYATVRTVRAIWPSSVPAPGSRMHSSWSPCMGTSFTLQLGKRTTLRDIHQHGARLMQLLRVSTAKHHREGLLDISGVVHAKYMANPSESLHPKVRDEVKSLSATCLFCDATACYGRNTPRIPPIQFGLHGSV